MPRTNRKAASGSGTIRKKTVTKNGKTYQYWEARYTEGINPNTGKQIQRSITGKTQREVSQKLKAATSSLDSGTYIAPNKQTVRNWLDIWTAEYLGGVKPRTVSIYKSDIRNYIVPAIGAIRLDQLDPHTIQAFYNRLSKEGKKVPLRDADGNIVKHSGHTVYTSAPLSAKTIKNIHGVLHHALKQAVLNGYLRSNPAEACILPRQEKQELKPLDEAQISAFIRVIKGNRFEDLFLVALFTGLRQGELLGLTWDCVNFDAGILTINKQLQLHQEQDMDAYTLVPTKNSRARTVAVAPFVLTQLKRRRAAQAQQKLQAGSTYHEGNLVFTDDLGKHLTKPTVYRAFKKAAGKIGRPDARFHDLRHSYAVAAIRSGDDIKTVQSNLGHATASFTLDVYGHVTDQMKQASAARMEAFISSVSSI